MKYIKIILFMLFAATVLFFGCKKDYPEIGNAPSKIAAMEGTWITEKVTQVDAPAKAAGEANAEMDVTSLLENFAINFTGDAFSFSVADVNFIGFSSGTWAFNDPAYPSKIILTNGLISKSFTVVAPPRQGWDWFIISFDRMSGGKKIIEYQYKLKKNPIKK